MYKVIKSYCEQQNEDITLNVEYIKINYTKTGSEYVKSNFDCSCAFCSIDDCPTYDNLPNVIHQ